MLEGVHLKEIIMAIFSALVGYAGWKVRRNNIKHDEAEQKQNTRLDALERRQNTFERDFAQHKGVIEERTKTIQDDTKAIKEYLLNRQD